jgi:hypothetical protein
MTGLANPRKDQCFQWYVAGAEMIERRAAARSWCFMGLAHSKGFMNIAISGLSWAFPLQGKLL